MGQGNQEKPRAKKGGWKNVEVLGPLLLSTVIALVGGLFTLMQHNGNQNQLKAERATALLKHLSSENQKESLLATEVVSFLCKQDQVSCELMPAIAKTASVTNSSDSEATKEQKQKSLETSVRVLSEIAVDGDKEYKDLAKESLKTLANDTTSQVSLVAREKLAKIDEGSAKVLPARVYIHLQKGDSREEAEELSAQFQKKGVVVPRINEVDKAPEKTDFRFFAKAKPSDLDAISKVLKEAGIDFNKVDLTNRFPETKNRPRHYEIWLAGSKSAQNADIKKVQKKKP